jgi:hypothetical protein
VNLTAHTDSAAEKSMAGRFGTTRKQSMFHLGFSTCNSLLPLDW